MRHLVGVMVLLLAVGTPCVVGCGEERIPCENFTECPPPKDECLYGDCEAGFCQYSARQYEAGCKLSDGSVGICKPHSFYTFSPDSPGCMRTSEPISCKHGLNDCCDWDDGTPCRVPDGREGTCLRGVCGGGHFCEGVVCDEPDNLCGSDQFCNWEGVCEFREVTRCPGDGSTCTFDECDPDIGCVYINRPNGAECALPGSDFLCCLLPFGFGSSCCPSGICMDGNCVPD
jgi:hypothetical protein